MNLNQSWPQQSTDDLRVDLAFRENLISESLNSKFAGILPEGVYYGFDVKVKGDGSAFEVEVGSAGKNAALVEVENPEKPALSAALTAKLPAGNLKTVSVEAGTTTYVVLEVYYRAVLQQDQSHKTTVNIKAVTSLSNAAHTRQLVLATINPPAAAPALLQEHVIQSRKVDLGTEQISDSYAMPSELGNIEFDPESGPNEQPVAYLVGFGNDALMGRFSIMDTLTGGVLEFTAARNTKSTRARINLIAKTDDFPATKVSINDVAGRTEVHVHFLYTGSTDDEIYVDLKAYDAHNKAGVGWVKAFEAAATDTVNELASIDIHDGHMGSSGVVIENGKPLADSYLGIDGKSQNAVKADLATVASTARNSERLGGFPASQFGVSVFTPDNADLRPPLAADPDTLSVPKAVIKHPKMPTSNEPYSVETTIYGNSSSAYRIQVATVFSDGDNLQDKLTYKRWLSGNYTQPLASAWKPELNPSDYRKQTTTRTDTEGRLLLSGTEVISKKALIDGRKAWSLDGYDLSHGENLAGGGTLYILIGYGRIDINGVISIYSKDSVSGRIEIDHTSRTFISHGYAERVTEPRIKTTMDGVALNAVTVSGEPYYAISVRGVGLADFRFTGEVATFSYGIRDDIRVVGSSGVTITAGLPFKYIRPNQFISSGALATNPPRIPATAFGVKFGGFNKIKLVGELYYWPEPNAKPDTHVPDRVLFEMNDLPNLSEVFLNSELAERYGSSIVSKTVRVYIPAIPYVLGSTQRMKPYADIILFFIRDSNGDWDVVLNGYFSQASLATSAPFFIWRDNGYTMTVKRLVVVPADAKAVF